MKLRTDMVCPLILLQETPTGLTKRILVFHFILFFLFKHVFSRSLFLTIVRLPKIVLKWDTLLRQTHLKYKWKRQ